MIPTKYILIRSWDADLYIENLSSCIIFNLNYPLILPAHSLFKISMISFICPYSFYNINNRCNKVYVTESDADGSNAQPMITITFPNGNYNMREITTELQSQLNALTSYGIVYSLVYNKNTNKITFSTVTANKRATFNFNQNYSMFEVLGFDEEQYIMTTAITLTSANSCILYPDDALFIRSNLVNGGFSFDTKNKNTCDVLQIVEIRCGINGYIYLENESTECLYASNIDQIQLKITDEDGLPIDLNNAHWRCTLKIETIDNPSSLMLKDDEPIENKTKIYDELINTILTQYNTDNTES